MMLACQEHLLPGNHLLAKWDAAVRYGFDGIELLGAGDFAFSSRLPELNAARRQGVVLPSVCVQMDHFIGDFDAERRRDAIANMRSLVSVIAEIGGAGAITPAAYGMWSDRLPPFGAPRSPADDRAVLVEGLGELAEHAKAEGVQVWLEPLNRYEDHMVNTLAQAVDLCDAVGHPAVAPMADFYHLNIEEADPPAALARHGHRVGHVHLSDSNRFEPGAGHVDFAAGLSALEQCGYEGCMAFECRLSGQPDVVLPAAVEFVKREQSQARRSVRAGAQT